MYSRELPPTKRRIETADPTRTVILRLHPNLLET
jgi:hypothetical protein